MVRLFSRKAHKRNKIHIFGTRFRKLLIEQKIFLEGNPYNPSKHNDNLVLKNFFNSMYGYRNDYPLQVSTITAALELHETGFYKDSLDLFVDKLKQYRDANWNRRPPPRDVVNGMHVLPSVALLIIVSEIHTIIRRQIVLATEYSVLSRTVDLCNALNRVNRLISGGHTIINAYDSHISPIEREKERSAYPYAILPNFHQLRAPEFITMKTKDTAEQIASKLGLQLLIDTMTRMLEQKILRISALNAESFKL